MNGDKNRNAGFVQVRLRAHVHKLLTQRAARINARLRRRKTHKAGDEVSLGDVVEGLLMGGSNDGA